MEAACEAEIGESADSNSGTLQSWCQELFVNLLTRPQSTGEKRVTDFSAFLSSLAKGLNARW